MGVRVGCGAGQEHTQPLSKLSYHSYQTGITVDGMVHPRVPNARGRVQGRRTRVRGLRRTLMCSSRGGWLWETREHTTRGVACEVEGGVSEMRACRERVERSERGGGCREANHKNTASLTMEQRVWRCSVGPARAGLPKLLDSVLHGWLGARGTPTSAGRSWAGTQCNQFKESAIKSSVRGDAVRGVGRCVGRCVVGSCASLRPER